MLLSSGFLCLWLGSFTTIVLSLTIHPEQPKDLSVQLCTHERRHAHGQMQYFPSNYKYCVAVMSNKNNKHLEQDKHETTFLDSHVEFRWRRVNDVRSCNVVYKGYQGEYSLHPDFGTYAPCQHSMSRHFHALAEALARSGSHTQSIAYNNTNEQCPITMLPKTYAEYVSCSLQENEWYLLTWTSNIRYETYQNKSYGIYHANHTTAWLFQPNQQLIRNGTEATWLKRLLQLNTRADGCERGELLVGVEEFWPLSETEVTVIYRVRDGHKRLYTTHLLTKSIDKWLSYSFDLRPIAGIHEVCVHVTLPISSLIRQRVCKQIVDHMDCPYVSTSHNINSKISIFIITITYLIKFF